MNDPTSHPTNAHAEAGTSLFSSSSSSSSSSSPLSLSSISNTSISRYFQRSSKRALISEEKEQKERNEKSSLTTLAPDRANSWICDRCTFCNKRWSRMCLVCKQNKGVREMTPVLTALQAFINRSQLLESSPERPLVMLETLLYELIETETQHCVYMEHLSKANFFVGASSFVSSSSSSFSTPLVEIEKGRPASRKLVVADRMLECHKTFLQLFKQCQQQCFSSSPTKKEKLPHDPQNEKQKQITTIMCGDGSAPFPIPLPSTVITHNFTIPAKLSHLAKVLPVIFIQCVIPYLRVVLFSETNPYADFLRLMRSGPLSYFCQDCPTLISEPALLPSDPRLNGVAKIEERCEKDTHRFSAKYLLLAPYRRWCQYLGVLQSMITIFSYPGVVEPGLDSGCRDALQQIREILLHASANFNFPF